MCIMAMGIETLSDYGTKPETTLQHLAGLEVLKPLSPSRAALAPSPRSEGGGL